MALQRGYFVAQSRRYLHTMNINAAADGMPGDSCYSYNPAMAERAMRINGGNQRDFSLSAAMLLRFEP